MYAYNYATGSHVPQGYAANSGYDTTPGHTARQATVATPSFVTAPAQVRTPIVAQVPTPIPTPRHTPTPGTALTPVQVPPGYYPIELAQFWRDEYKRGQPYPLHWALFVRTAPPSPGSAPAPARTRPPAPETTYTPPGNFYELVGTPDTYTAQFLSAVAFAPETLPDWRGTHVIGWVHPAQLGTFERLVRQVPVLRHRPDWRSQEWAYEVVRALGGDRSQGVFVEGVTFVGLQRQMGRLLEAWENGDI